MEAHTQNEHNIALDACFADNISLSVFRNCCLLDIKSQNPSYSSPYITVLGSWSYFFRREMHVRMNRRAHSSDSVKCSAS